MGFFDSAGERLYKEMDRAMRDLNTTTPSLKREILAKTESLISRLQAESERWSSEGKRKAARHLQAEAKRQRDFDIASYAAQFFAGAWLEAEQMPNDPHAKHILKTIELLIDESPHGSSLETEKSGEISAIEKLFLMCFTVVLGVYFGKQTTDLKYLVRLLNETGQPVVNQAHAIAFGMIDGLAQMKNMSQNEHLAMATMIFLTHLSNDLTEASGIIAKLIRVVPGHQLFEFIRAGGETMVKFTSTQDFDEFTNLVYLLMDEPL